MRTCRVAARTVTLGIGFLMVTSAAPAATALVTVPQGGVARWSGLAAAECGIYGKRYAAIDGSCYYPVDIRARPGTYEIALWENGGKQHLGTATVEAAHFADVNIALPPALARFIDISAEDKARAASEAAAVSKILRGAEEKPHFNLPLRKPAATLPASEDDFGNWRVFNDTQKSLHSGRDYPVGAGKAVRAVAAGRVALVADHFFTGNAVYVDHGAGLVSMVFHLDSTAVKAGQQVKRGEVLGTIGASGRATGPHLHLGLRWLGKRIDPALLLAPPSKLPSVSDSKRVAEAKIRAAERKESDETDMPLDDEG